MRAFSPVLILILFLITISSFPSQARAQSPSPEDTLSAFSTLQRHIRAWSPLTEEDKLPPALGACLTLKLRGEVIARATAWSPDPFAEDAATSDVLRRTFAQALKLAEPRLGIPNDALRDDAIRQTAQDITLSLELAGPLIAIEPNTWDDAEMLLRPGLDGVAVLNRGPGASPGKATPDLQSIFPSQMLLTNTLPHRALGSAIAQTIGEGGGAAALDDPKKIRDKHALRFYRFRTTHAAQTAANSSPIVLVRGQRLLPSAQPFTVRDARDMAAALAEHLLGLQAKDGSIIDARGVSTPGSNALATIAFSSFASWAGGESDVSNRAYEGARKTWWRLSEDSDKKGFEASTPDRFVAAVAAWTTPISNRGVAQWCGTPQASTASKWLQTLSRDDGSLASVRAALRPTERPLLYWTLARVDPACDFLTRKSSSEAERIHEIEQVFADEYAATPETQLVATMPWQGWAEMALLKRTADQRRQREQAVQFPRALALRRMRDQVWQHQLTPLTATEDTQDMIGGIVFTSGLAEGGSGGGNPYPTWQCVRPLAFIATMLGDPRLTTPQERPREIANLLLAMRYLRQLQVDDTSAWMYPNPALAKGGIRAAVWDSSQPTDATSLTLLCVTELLKSLDKLAAEKPAAPQPAPTPPAAK